MDQKKNPLLIILGISAFFFVVFLTVAVGTVMSLNTSGQSDKKIFSRASSSIGVIEVKGAIMDSKRTLDQIERFTEDKRIKGVVLRINSPGGAVAPSQEIYDGLKKLGKEKPVYSSMSSVAASGGYYIACGTKKIFANAGTLTGSIGVIMQFADLSKLFQWAKVNPYNIKTGKFKDTGSPNREMTVEEKDLLQAMIDNVLAQFRRAVAGARNLSMEKVIELSDGRIYSGEQAKDAKLVDELGGFQDAVDALAKEVGIQGKPSLIYGSKKKKLIERLFDGGDDDDAEAESSSSSLGGALHSLARIAALLDGSGLNQVSAPTSRKLVGPLFMLPRALSQGE